MYFGFEGNGCWYLKEASETSELVGVDNAKECSNYRTTALISHASKVMSLLFNMLSRLVSSKVMLKLPTSAGSLKKQESSRKTSISALLTMPKPLCGSQ